MMINRRRAYGGKSLPYDAEIEYLSANGTQYIDTGILANGEFEFDYKFRATNVTGNTVIGGARSSSQFLHVAQISDAKVTYLYFGYLGEYYQTTDNTFSKNTDCTVNIVYKSGQQQVYINGTQRINRTDTGTEALNLPIYLYKRNFHSSSDSVAGLTGWFYYFKIKQNGVLVRDFIPVRLGNIGYMYDKVSGQLFGNQGTGSFILGPDV